MHDTRFDVAGLGNALVDALARIDDDLLVELKLTRGEMHPVGHAFWDEVYKRVEARGVEIHTGGSCANTIAALGLMGARTVYCGQVANDELGRLYARRLQDACGGHALQFSDVGNTGKCLSLVSTSDAERTMLTDLGAAVTMDGLGTFDEDVRDSRLLHVTGYLLLGDPMAERCMEAIAIANQTEIPVSLDVADPFVVRTVRDRMRRVVEEFADIVFLNNDEAEALVGARDAAALDILEDMADTIVLKLGSQGSVISHEGERCRVQVHEVDAIDTTGAGDAFAAGFLYGYIHGWPMARAGELGSRIAAMTVAQLGAVVRDRELLASHIAEVSK